MLTFNHFNFNVRNMEQSLAFYKEALGLTFQREKRAADGSYHIVFLQDEAREGVYLMDEPEAALSPQRQLTLMRHIYYMAMEGSQFIIATHSPILLGLPGARILNFSEEGIHPLRYEETESYQITKLFLERRKQMLDELFKDMEE